MPKKKATKNEIMIEELAARVEEYCKKEGITPQEFYIKVAQRALQLEKQFDKK